ncbi:MAG: hypothetical protein KTR30_09920 [Saprospiraceae bacterium]|nr:hypothetical protein [Saprospiraceae bacterium]
MEDIRKMARIQLLIIVVFVIGKAIRPSILETQAPEFFKIFLLSFPNFCESVIGVLTLTMLGLYANRRLKLSNQAIYIIATLLAAVYVITQEFRIHNLGGKNIYDPNDVIFSVIGLLVGFACVYRIQPKISR